MAKPRIIRPMKAILGMEFPRNAEWDAGHIPCAATYNRVRITVKKEDNDRFTVKAVGFSGAKRLVELDVAVFPCETCAKAFALCIVFSPGYAVCEKHNRDGFSEADIFDGLVVALRSAMGIGEEWQTLDEGSKHRVKLTTREILDGKLEWAKVVDTWHMVIDQNPLENLSYLIRYWRSLLSVNTASWGVGG